VDRVAAPAASQRAIAVLFVTALTAAASQVSFPLPFTPVPLTLQPVVVLLGAAALGARLGASAQVLYLLLGMAGLPVFAFAPDLPQGLLRLIGPSGGYLMAYPLAAWLTGALAERGMDRHFRTSLAAMAAGLVVIFSGGVLWLAKDLGLEAALSVGLVPFVVVDTVKILAAATVMPAAWRVVRD
jgi:biotin transport system substrate-specific component